MAWLLFFLALIVGYLIFQFGLSLWEKHPIRSYGPTKSHEKEDWGPYLLKVEAEANDLIGRSVHQHLRFDIISVCWFSPQRDIMILSGEGKIAKMPIKQTWLYSRLTNGQFLVTSDGFDEGDPSGLSQIKRIVNGKLSELLRKHRVRLEASTSVVLPFKEQTGADSLEAMNRERAERLLQLGRAQWVEDEQTQWRFTATGALCVLGNFFKQFVAGLSQFWRV